MNKRATLLLSLLLGASRLWALPSGPDPQAGSVQVQQGTHWLNLQQLSNQAIINWNSFSIGANQIVRVLQPHQAAILVNRVVGQDPSLILGQLQANGQVWLLNPNGILFGPSAQVNVGGLLATTLDIHNRDFLEGRYRFQQPAGQPLAAVVNQGELRISPQGSLILAAPLVSNEGLIVANLGQVSLLAGQQVALSLDPQGLIHYQLSQPGASAGPVLLSQAMVSQVLQGVVQSGGIPEGELLTLEGGRLSLSQGGGRVLQAGQILGAGSNVTLDSTQSSHILPGSQTSAGSIRVLSQGSTSAQAGALLDVSSQQGPGGFLEVSGHNISLASQVNLSGAPGSPAGSLLIDPDFLTIIPGQEAELDGNNPIPANLPPSSSNVSTDFLQSIEVGNVTLQANNSITFAPGANLTMLPGVGLNLDAISGNITFADVNTTVQTQGASLNFTAGNNIVLGTLTALPFNLDPPGNHNLVAGGSITSAAGLAPDRNNLNGTSATLSAGANIALSGNITQLAQVQAGNLTLENRQSLLLGAVNVTQQAQITTAGNLLLTQSLQAGQSLLLSAGAIQLDALGNGANLSAPTIGLFSNSTLNPGPGPASPSSPPLLQCDNLVMSAAGDLTSQLSSSASNISLSSSQGSISFDGIDDLQVVSQMGINGVQAANVTVNAAGDLSLQAPVVATSAQLSSGGNLLQAMSGSSLQASQVQVSAAGSIGSSANPLQMQTAQFSASAGGDIQAQNSSPNLGVSNLAAGGQVNLDQQGNLTIQSLQAAGARINASGNAKVTSQIQGNLEVRGGGEVDLSNVGQLQANLFSSSGNLSLNNLGDLDLSGSNSQAAGNLSLEVDGNLTLSNTLQAGQQVAVNVSGVFTALSGAAIRAPQLSLNVASSSGNPLNSQIQSLSGQVGSGGIGLVQSGNLVLNNFQSNSLDLSLSGDVSGSLTSSNLLLNGQNAALQLNSAGPINLQANLVSGQFTTPASLQASVNASQIEINSGGNLSLQLGSNSQVGANVQGQAQVRTPANLTLGAVNATQLQVSAANLSLTQALQADTFQFNLGPGGVSGPGSLVGQQALVQSQGPIQLNTSLNGLAAHSNSSLTIVESNGLAPLGSGLSGTSVNLTVNQGHLDLSDPSLGSQPAIVASQVIDLNVPSGNILGSNSTLRPDLQAPQINFLAGGTVGNASVPIYIQAGNRFSASQPSNVQEFGQKPIPPVPPPPAAGPDPLDPGVIVRNNPGLTVIVDATSLGLPVGGSLLLQALDRNPKSPQGLWRVAWELPSARRDPLRRPYLLDLSLEQLLRQPAVSGFLLLPLEALLKEPLLSPFLEKSLEELQGSEIDTPPGED